MTQSAFARALPDEISLALPARYLGPQKKPPDSASARQATLQTQSGEGGGGTEAGKPAAGIPTPVLKGASASGLLFPIPGQECGLPAEDLVLRAGPGTRRCLGAHARFTWRRGRRRQARAERWAPRRACGGRCGRAGARRTQKPRLPSASGASFLLTIPGGGARDPTARDRTSRIPGAPLAFLTEPPPPSLNDGRGLWEAAAPSAHGQHLPGVAASSGRPQDRWPRLRVTLAPDDREDQYEGRASSIGDAVTESSTAAVETGFFWLCFGNKECFLGEMLYSLKEEMAPQELTRRLATVITHVDEIMQQEVRPLVAVDIIEQLHRQFAILSGGRGKDGAPIITFPEFAGFKRIPDEDFLNVMTYLTSIPSAEAASIGFVIVIDRRRDKWSSIKASLTRIAVAFPGNLQLIFILRPSHFIQRTFTEIGIKYYRDEFKMKVPIIMLNSISDLHSYIDRSQLTQELGGTLEYRHSQWISHRTVSTNLRAL
nr:uncharacterized protein LOC103347401 [Oryctolagus cuniculus]